MHENFSNKKRPRTYLYRPFKLSMVGSTDGLTLNPLQLFVLRSDPGRELRNSETTPAFSY